MRRQQTTKNFGTVEKVTKYEDDLTEEYPTLDERTTYCDTLDGKMKGNVCHYAKKHTEEFMFDFVQRRGQILEINGVSSTANSTIIKTDAEIEFQKNDTIYFANSSYSKIESYETKPINDKNNRRSEYIRKMWYLTLS